MGDGQAVGTVGGWTVLRDPGRGWGGGRARGGAGFRWGSALGAGLSRSGRQGARARGPGWGGAGRVGEALKGRHGWGAPSPGEAPCVPVERGARLLSFQLTEARKPGSSVSRRDLGASWGRHGWSESIANMAHLRGFANQVRIGFLGSKGPA